MTHIIQDCQGQIYKTVISLACEYPHIVRHRGLENFMTGQVNKEIDNYPM